MTTATGSCSTVASAPARALGQRSEWLPSLVIGLVWPIAGALHDILTYRKRRSLAGFAVFCIYAGWVMLPSPDADGADYLRRIDQVRWGFSSGIGEPIPATIAEFVGRLDLPGNVYFMVLGALYAAIVTPTARVLFASGAGGSQTNFANRFYTLAFFLNFPVMAALNARYQLGMWEMLLASLLALHGRWSAALVAGAIGICIHFGFSIFVVALLMLLIMQRAGRAQVVLTYVLVCVSFATPTGFLISLGEFVTERMGGNFGEKVAATTTFAQAAQDGLGVERNAEAAWFLTFYTKGIYYALLLSGQLLWLRIKDQRATLLYQSWMLILLMLALQNFLAGEPETTARVGRNVTSLLVMFHALWFLQRPDGGRLSLTIAFGPILFYFAVYYRMWLGEGSLALLLPTPFGAFHDALPRVYDYLAGRPSVY